MGKGGDVFVLDMGEPVKIMELAKSMVKLYGLVPYLVDFPLQIEPEKDNIPIYVTGLRKSEKLFEELLIGNDPSPTEHPRIMTASEASIPINQLSAILDHLIEAYENYDMQTVLDILHDLPLD